MSFNSFPLWRRLDFQKIVDRFERSKIFMLHSLINLDAISEEEFRCWLEEREKTPLMKFFEILFEYNSKSSNFLLLEKINELFGTNSERYLYLYLLSVKNKDLEIKY